MERTKVKDVMTRGVLTIHEKASVREAVKIMADYDISGLAVTSSMDAVTGVLSEMDIIKVLDKDLDAVKIEEIMTSPAVIISQQESLRRACQMMKEKNIHRLIVQSEDVGLSTNGKSPTSLPCGILSISDVIEHLFTQAKG
ncbi:MAG: CBS domain-containing protein [Desulfobacterales bacterium]|nr:CBS domain-containing protein [Desulfobacterales bacterium]